MSKKIKIIIILSSVGIALLAISLGFVFGIKPVVTLDYGYVSDTPPEGLIGLLIRDTIDFRETPTDNIKVMRFTRYSPPRPIRNGHSFLGWYKDSACTVPWVNGVDKVRSDITLYAKWEKL